MRLAIKNNKIINLRRHKTMGIKPPGGSHTQAIKKPPEGGFGRKPQKGRSTGGQFLQLGQLGDGIIHRIHAAGQRFQLPQVR